MKRLATLPVAAAAALLAAVSASAHVTLNPSSASANSFSRFAIRVPNERPKAATTKLTVRLPAGLDFVSFQVKPGWRRSVTTAGKRVATVTWTATSTEYAIKPNEFDEFGISMKLPNTPGQTLTFPAVQVYSNGETVRWIGPASADEPAPRLKLTAAVKAE